MDWTDEPLSDNNGNVCEVASELIKVVFQFGQVFGIAPYGLAPGR